MLLGQSLIDGLMMGGIYAAVAVANSLIWATTRTANMALIQLLAVGAFVAYATASLGLIPVLVIAAAVCAVLAVVTHYIAVKPTLKKSHLTAIIATLALGLIIQSVLALGVGDSFRVMPPLLPRGNFVAAGFFFSYDGLVTIAVTVAVVLVAITVLNRSSVGLSFRASAWEPELAATYGVRTAKIQILSVLFAGAMVGVAGVLIASMSGSVSPYIGLGAGLQGIVAMLIGGAGSLPGALLGGLLVGVLTAVGSITVGGGGGEMLALSALLAVLILRPSGLLAKGATV